MSAIPRIRTMKAWIERRTDKGECPTADEIWKRIHQNWPNAPSAEKEAIFEGVAE